MAGELQGKRALITGSSSGIGEACARLFAAQGARVFIHGRDPARTEAVGRDLKAPWKTADLKDPAAAQALVDAVNAAFGGELDILIANAGGEASGQGTATWFEATPDIWLSTYNANAISAVRMIHAFAPGMKARGWGRVINMTSEVAHTPHPTIPDYAGSKASMVNFTVSLAKALARTGVTSNCISPGLIVTRAVKNWLTGMAKAQGLPDDWPSVEKWGSTKIAPNLIGRLGQPEDIARAALFLASPAADYVTGLEMQLDGGRNL